MKTDEKSLKDAQELMAELLKLNDVLDVTKNYDLKSYCYFISQYNNNKGFSKEVKIQMPAEVRCVVDAYVKRRISEIRQKLEEL